MITLPVASQALIAELPIPDDLRVIPPNFFILNFVIDMASEYRAIVSDLDHPKKWTSLKARFSERCIALKIGDYISLYEHPDRFLGLALNVSFVAEFKVIIEQVAIDHGFEDLVRQPAESADPIRLKAFFDIAYERIIDWIMDVNQAFDESEIQESENYWNNIHPTLPTEEQKKAILDVQIFASVFFFGFYNAISVMAYGETLTSLVQRALSDDVDADIAMCKAVRVDNALRQHPKFMERYLQATNKSESKFLDRYNITSSPFTHKIRFSGVYFLLSLLDAFGMLGKLTNPQILDLCDHARLDRWENRIEDAGYLAKRRSTYLKHKFFE